MIISDSTINENLQIFRKSKMDKYLDDVNGKV